MAKCQKRACVDLDLKLRRLSFIQTESVVLGLMGITKHQTLGFG